MPSSKSQTFARIGAAMMLALLFSVGGSRALAQLAPFAPAGQHFTIPIPPNPAETDSTAYGNSLRTWTVTDGDFLYIVTHAVSGGAAFTENQLAGDMNDFIKATNATLLGEQSISWPSPSGAARALRFSFRLPNGLVGKGVFVVDGQLGYGDAIIDRHQGSQSPFLDQYVSSLTILP
ncbi:MAG: hypothetical protein ACREEB_16825 [Caulobacteraceae bacterium]